MTEPTTSATTATDAPAPLPPATVHKPGWLTSEHLMTLIAIILTTLEGSDVIPIGSPIAKCIAMSVTVLAALGYTAARTVVKTAMVLCLVAFGLNAAGAGLSAGCAWTKNEAQTVKTAAVDCTKGELGTAVKLFSPMLDQLIVLATGGDGHLDAAQLEAPTKALAGDIGKCVLTASIAKALKPATPAPGAPQSSPLLIDPGDLHAFYAAHVGGGTYITEYGSP